MGEPQKRQGEGRMLKFHSGEGGRDAIFNPNLLGRKILEETMEILSGEGYEQIFS